MLELPGSQADYRAVLAWEVLEHLNPCWQSEINQQVLIDITGLPKTKLPIQPLQPLRAT